MTSNPLNQDEIDALLGFDKIADEEIKERNREDRLWKDIRKLAESNEVLRDMLDRVIVWYRLNETQNDS
jgi:hypothetical protein